MVHDLPGLDVPRRALAQDEPVDGAGLTPLLPLDLLEVQGPALERAGGRLDDPPLVAHALPQVVMPAVILADHGPVGPPHRLGGEEDLAAPAGRVVSQVAAPGARFDPGSRHVPAIRQVPGAVALAGGGADGQLALPDGQVLQLPFLALPRGDVVVAGAYPRMTGGGDRGNQDQRKQPAAPHGILLPGWPA